MNLLAFDTSTEQLAVAVQAGPQRLARNAPGGAAASATLLPLAQALLAEAGLAWRDLHAVGFGRGPGAFTGLRTSCAAAQGLAAGLGCPVLAIDSLLVVAEDAWAQATAAGMRTTAFDIGVAMDARIGEIYAGRWQRSPDGRWQALEAARLTDAATLAAGWAGAAAPAWLAGSALALPAWAAAWTDAGGAVDGPHCLPTEGDRAGALLRLAVAAWQAGEGLPAAQALPLYLRDKVALTTAEREQAARARATAAAAP